MEYLNGSTLCLTGPEFLAVVPKGTYDSLKKRGNITVHGRGGNGGTILVEYESLPPTQKALVQAYYGNPYELMAKSPILDLIQIDYKAIDFFNTFESAAGNPLSERDLIELPNDAAILNAIKHLLNDKKALKRVLNVQIGQFWTAVTDLIKGLKTEKRWPNTLPVSERRLKPIFNSYCASGYSALIPGNYGNSNSKVHGPEFTHLIMSLYTRPGAKPYAKDVHEDYKAFMDGKLHLIETKDDSGELFDPANYCDEDGNPITISQTQVWNIINKPINRATADAMRNSGKFNRDKHVPLAHRHAPSYAFSKITMDDLQFPFKLTDGEDAIGYQIMDVASGCIIGKSFGKSAGKDSGKDRNLFMSSIKDMFRFIVNSGFGVPAEIEVEQHISSTFKDDVLAEGYFFPFVRWCRAQNPREKRAENIFRAKKYQQQHKREGFHGRFYGRNEANVPNQDKQSRRYSFDEVVANEMADIEAHNHAEHPKYPGKTRWQVLQEMQCPTLSQPHLPVMAKYIGESTRDAVQIYHNQWFWAGSEKFEIPTATRERLTTRYIMPYWIPAADGTVGQVYVYQNDKYLACCKKIETFNESRAERTDEDERIMSEQFAYRKQFDTQVKERTKQLSKLKVAKPYTAPKTPVKIADTTPLQKPKPAPANNAEYWREQALASL